MAHLRKMLGSADSPYILSLMRLIETQSKNTLVKWCLTYCEEDILPIFEKYCPSNSGPRRALNSAKLWLGGKVKLAEVKDIILNECHTAARRLNSLPAAQAAARACGQAASVIHAPTHSLGMAFYGSAAIAYDRVGTNLTAQEYDLIASQECAKMEEALRKIAVYNETNPAKVNWYC